MFWTSAGARPSDVTALDARVTSLEGETSGLAAADVVLDGRLDAVEATLDVHEDNLGGTFHWSINNIPTSGDFVLDAFWEGGTATAGNPLRSILVPADAIVHDLRVQIQSGVGGANSITWTVDVDSGAGFVASSVTVTTPTNETTVVEDTTHEVAAPNSSRVRLKGVITGTLSSGALFLVASCRYRWDLS